MFALSVRERRAHQKRLVLDRGGVRWGETGARSWSVAWAELAGMSVSRLERATSPTGEDRLRRVLVDLRPRFDADFRSRHPEMGDLAGPNGTYRQPLWASPRDVRQIELAVLRYAPPLWCGVRDETVGRSIAPNERP